MDEIQVPKLRADEKQIENYRYNYNKGKLGRGTFGTVFRGYNINTRTPVAIKLIKKSDVKVKSDQESLLNEISIMRSLKNPNIIEIIDVLQTDNNYYIILEYCDQGDLEHLINKQKGINPQDHYHFLLDILTAFTSLIKQGIMHRDLKPANILVQIQDKKKIYKLADFGLAKNIDNFKHQIMESKVGTPFYMSPQILNGQPYTSKSDIWSLGLMLYQIVYQRSNYDYILLAPWTGRSEQELLYNITHLHLNFPDHHHHIPPLCKDFILNCLQIKEENRFSWETLYQHPYVGEHFLKFQMQQKNYEHKLTYVIEYLREKLQDIKQLEYLFSKLDTSGDNVLNFEEFTELIHTIDTNFVEQDIKYIFDEFDADGNGTVDFDEFKQILYPQKPKVCELIRSLSKKNLNILKELNKVINKYEMSPRSLFRRFDTSQNNALDREELTLLLQRVDLNKTLAPKDIDEIIHVFDENGDGEVQYDEFKKVLLSVQEGKQNKILIEAEAQVQKMPAFETKASLSELNKHQFKQYLKMQSQPVDGSSYKL